MRYCLTDAVRRDMVNNEDLRFSGYTGSGKEFAIVAKLSDVNRWVNGELIQICFPYLNAEEREILMTGNDNESWERMFGRMREEEE
jgi:hypothetical protein